MKNVSRRPKILFISAGLMLVLGLAGFWAVPRLLTALPGPYRQRLPHELLRLITTPLPTALPAPALSIAQPAITIPAILFPSPTLEPVRLVPAAADRALPLQATLPTLQINAPLTPSAPVPLKTTPTSLPSPTPAPTVLPATYRVEGLKIVPQKFNNCGPSNLSVNLTFYGHHVDQLEIAEVLWESRGYTQI